MQNVLQNFKFYYGYIRAHALNTRKYNINNINRGPQFPAIPSIRCRRQIRLPLLSYTVQTLLPLSYTFQLLGQEEGTDVLFESVTLPCVVP